MGKTIIHSVLLFDGQSVQPKSTVTFDSTSGEISSVKKSSGLTSYPNDATVIDGSGYTLLPGLIDAHMHCHNLHLPEGQNGESVLVTPLKSGVTTVCDMHSAPETVHARQKAVREDMEKAKADKEGKVTMSDLKSCHYAATIEGGWPKPIVLAHDPTEELKAIVATWPSVTPETAADFIQAHKGDGADYIKLMQENCCSLALPTGSIPVASLELQTAVVKAAHAENMVVVGHATAVESTEIVLNSGADGLTHTFIDQPPPDSIVELYKKTKAFVIPTLVVLSSLTNEEQDLRDKFAAIAAKKCILDDFTKQNMLEILGMKDPAAKMEYAYQTVQKLKAEGIDVVAGTDSVAGLKGTAIGPSLWMELEMYVEKCGMSVTDALASATSVTARRFGFGDRGKVEEGKRADLVLVKGDVTHKLADLWEGEGIVGVWKEGVKAA